MRVLRRAGLAVHEPAQVKHRHEPPAIAKHPSDIRRSLGDLPQLDTRDDFHHVTAVERIPIIPYSKHDVQHKPPDLTAIRL
jgi:hypothetical protein